MPIISVNSSKAEPHSRSPYRSTANPIAASKSPTPIRVGAGEHAFGENSVLTLIVMMVFLVFLPVLKNDFVDSDSKTLVDNLGYHGLGWDELRWMFTAFHFGQYQPIAWVTLGLDYTLWRADPFGYHWTNLLLHIGNATLVYHVSLELCSYLPRDDQSVDKTSIAAISGFAALSFAIHPLRVESVVWASARGELVAAGLSLLTLFCYLKASNPCETRRSSKRLRIISVGAFLLSLLASPSGVVLPAIFLALDYYLLGRLAGLPSRFGSEMRRLRWEKIPYFVLSIACFSINFMARHYQHFDSAIYQDDLLTSFMHQLAAPAFYLWKALLPIGLSPAYELSGLSLATYISASAVMFVGVVAVRNKCPALALTWICYLLLAMPILRDDFPAQQLVADRYTYLAGIPWALFLGVAVNEWCRSRVIRRFGRWLPPVAVGFAVILFAGLGIASWNQVQVWRDRETLWKNSVQVNPTSQAHFNLATLFEAQGKYDDAVASYRQVVAINAQRLDAHEKAAQLLQKRGNIPEAIGHYRKVVEFNPHAIDAREKLADGLVNQGEIGEAVQHFRKVLESAPERNEARAKLGTILAVAGRLDEAAEILTAAVKADPNDGTAMMRLGQVLAAQGKLGEAVQYFREATRLRPQDAEAHQNLGRGLLELGKKDEATNHLHEALRILRSTPAAR